MSRCRLCDAPIIWAFRAKGQKIALDQVTEPLGADRYAVDEQKRATPVDPGKQAYAHREHRVTCPYQVATRPFGE